ncbi:uncharacterized protein LOC134078923 [Sardina pilchardus]|uniref:uncharacterized protein LOC134078923 n=1 Tax=Sardina pilchardus TaxID=27697 RepID=UPI002E0F28B7
MTVLCLLILIPLLGLGSLCTANETLPLSMASQINTTVGQSVLLPCFISPLKDTRVYWQTAEDSKGNVSVLHFINMGVGELQHQAPQYQNRTSVDLSQAAAGNLSLELRNVTEADNQTTFCCLYSIATQVPMEVSNVTLMVLQEPDVARTRSGCSRPHQSHARLTMASADSRRHGVREPPLLHPCQSQSPSLDQVLGPKPSLDQVLGPNPSLDQVLGPKPSLDQVLDPQSVPKPLTQGPTHAKMIHMDAPPQWLCLSLSLSP